jgi:hypothetical protein
MAKKYAGREIWLLGDAVKTTAKGAAGVAPVAAQATSPSGLTIPKEDQKKIMNSPKAVKAGVYRSWSGQEDWRR